MKVLLKLLRRPYVFPGIAATLLAAVATYFLHQSVLPYQFTVLETHSLKWPDFKLYHDLDKDGLGESIASNNDTSRGAYYLMIKNYTGGIIDQLNYTEPIMPFKSFFIDYTGDGYDEVFAFTQKNDSIFLYIHDIPAGKKILNRFFVDTFKQPISHLPLDIGFLSGNLVETGEDGKKEFFFVLSARHALYPRTIYRLDIEQKQIVKKFETSAVFSDFMLLDLDGDDKKEIIAASSAYANIHFPAEYKDDRCWLFVLDRELKPLFKPLEFGEFTSGLTFTHLIVDNERFLLLRFYYEGKKDLPDYFYLINAMGNIELSHQVDLRGHPRTPPVVYRKSNSLYLFAVLGENRLVKMDARLNVLKEKKVALEKFFPNRIYDLNGDGDAEIICTSDGQGISVIDHQLNLLAEVSPPLKKYYYETYRKTGPGSPIELGIHHANTFYRMAFQKNSLYSYLSLSFPLFLFIFFTVLTGISHWLSLVYLNFQYLQHSLWNSDNGILFLNPQGKIIQHNQRIQNLLNHPHFSLKRRHFQDVLSENPEFAAPIQRGIDNQQPVSEPIRIERGDFRFRGEIKVRPFVVLGNMPVGYWVEVIPSKPSESDARLQLWSKLVAPIAHSIKSPLLSIGSNIEVLKMRLQKLPEVEQAGFAEELADIQSELRRIYHLTRKFVKFSNLKPPQYREVAVQELLQKAAADFQQFLNGDLRLETDIDPDTGIVFTDPDYAGMIFEVLMENAIDALKGQGLIAIHVTVSEEMLEPARRFVTFEIADTGPGIPPEKQKEIFQPGFSTRPGGNGMGLAYAKEIVEGNGGQIGLYSREGFGAVFRFSLPASREDILR